MQQARFKRILLKLSGEALMGDKGYGISPEVLNYVANEIKKVYTMDVELAVVVGGGNIFRGVSASSMKMERTPADHMGMLATVINSLALQDAMEKIDIPTRVQSAITMPQVAEPLILRRAIRHLEKARVVIFAAGTGNPFFSTDTAAVLRAKEVKAEILIKATKVNGLYDSDPEKNPNARFIKKATYMEVLANHLSVMDTTAISLAMDNDLPLAVFDLKQADNIYNFVNGLEIGSLIDK